MHQHWSTGSRNLIASASHVIFDVLGNFFPSPLESECHGEAAGQDGGKRLSLGHIVAVMRVEMHT